MKDIIFREYDIRGVVDKELFIDQVYDLARAIAFYFKQRNPQLNRVAIGMDGRTHSPAIKDALCKGLTDSGINVLFVGLCPTPALYFALYNLDVDGGLMITASHNSKEYNGIKICLGTVSIWGAQLQQIKNLYKERKHITTDHKGTITDHPIILLYIDWLVDHFKDLKNMKLSVIIDCGNGAAGTVLPQLIKKMKWENVQLLFPEVDGTYPNHEADPTVIENMQELKNIMLTTNTQLGIGLDGDCDRMVPMTKEGKLVLGDKLLALFAQQVLKDYPNASVVFDIKSSKGLIELLKQWGAHPIMSPSGHAIIKDMMLKHKALLGGELSCHFFFHDRYFGYDDGIYAMLRLFEIIIQSGKTLTELLTVFPKKFSSRELRLECKEADKQTIVDDVKKQFAKRDDISMITLDGIRVTMPYGWGIIRPSNTQSLLSMRFESDNKEGLQKVMDDFIHLLSGHLSSQMMQELQQERDKK